MSYMRVRVPTERFADLQGSQAGLTTAEAEARHARYGANDIVEAAPATLWMLAGDTLRDPMLWFLVGTAALFLWLGDRLEALVLLSAMIPLVGMDAVVGGHTANFLDRSNSSRALRPAARDSDPQAR